MSMMLNAQGTPPKRMSFCCLIMLMMKVLMPYDVGKGMVVVGVVDTDGGQL
jgi:hypothetical protein